MNTTYDNLQPDKFNALDVRSKPPVAELLRPSKEDATTGQARKTLNVNTWTDVSVCTSATPATALIVSTRMRMNSFAMSRMRVDDKDGCLWEPVELVDCPAPLGREVSLLGRTGRTLGDLVLEEGGLLLRDVWCCGDLDERAGGCGRLCLALRERARKDLCEAQALDDRRDDNDGRRAAWWTRRCPAT